MTHRVINYNNDPKCNQTIFANPMTRDLWKLIVGTANATSNNSSMIIDDISRNEFLRSVPINLFLPMNTFVEWKDPWREIK